MLTYFALTGLLLVFAWWEANAPPRSRGPVSWATAILIIFVGLRFETGADWVEYENLLITTAPLFDQLPSYFAPNLVVEPGFGLLLAIVNTLGLSFQTFLFMIAAFSFSVLAGFAWRYSNRPVLVLLWYCGFALLLGQMAALRQVTSYSFVLLAFVARDKGRIGWSLIWAAIAVSMHVFAAILLPIVYLRVRPPRSSITIGICAIGFVAVLFGYNLFAILVDPLSSVFGGIIGLKLELYNSVGVAAISTTSILLFIWHAGALVLINRPSLPAWRQPVVRMAIFAAIWSLFAHSYLATTPAIWNRVLLLSMPLEMVALTRCYADLLNISVWRAAAPAAVWALASASLAYSLSQENALPYVPYQSAVQVWITGNGGSGRMRYAIEQRRLEQRIEQDQQAP